METFFEQNNFDGEKWKEYAIGGMENAVKHESSKAVARGDIDSDGIPLLTVFVEGCWTQKYYRKNHHRLSGVVAIVGYYTRMVLYMSVRNQYCFICSRSQKFGGSQHKSHKCYQNWSGTSSTASSMEADIIAEGFLLSESIYKVRYAKLVTDGSNNCYQMILDSNPYATIKVEKIECKNYLLNKYCSELQDLVSSSSEFGHSALQHEIGARINKLKGTVVTSIKRRIKGDRTSFDQRINELKEDIINGPRHVFGDHTLCKERGYLSCWKQKTDDRSLIQELENSGFLERIMDILSYLVENSRSLLLGYIITSIERSISSKNGKSVVGDKRTKFSLERSTGYKQVRFNERVSANHSNEERFQHATGTNEVFSFGRKRRFETAAQQKLNSKRFRRHDQDCERVNLSKEERETRMQMVLQKLQRTENECRQLERKTVNQRDSALWRNTRKNLLTASHFGDVCNKKPHTGCQTIVKNILHFHGDSHSMYYGRENERNAILQIEQTLGVNVEKCGLFIDTDQNFLGATPDGLISEEGIVEVKCPYSARNLTPDEAILQGYITFWNRNKERTCVLDINKNHKYFYQVQGQLHITKRLYCIFAVWTPLGMKCVTIDKDDDFWRFKMVEKLVKFYMDCLLPEIAFPAWRRGIDILNPTYIVEAKNDYEKQKKNKLETKLQKMATKAGTSNSNSERRNNVTG